MPVEYLVKLVQDFLDAEVLLEQRRSECDDDAAPQEERFEAARRRLEDRLARTGDEAPERALAVEAEAYLSAVDAFHRARANRRDRPAELDAAARQLERAQRDLQEMIYRFARHGHAGPGEFPKRLLVAVDLDDEPSEWAVGSAIGLADLLPARIKLVHVLHPVLTDRWDEISRAAELDQVARQRAAILLRAMQAKVPAGIGCEVLVRDGRADAEIIGAARRWGADFILMGTRGHGRIARFLLGSTAESVIRMAPCPVITVGQPPTSAVDLSEVDATTVGEPVGR